jgi:hypothetical protein
MLPSLLVELTNPKHIRKLRPTQEYQENKEFHQVMPFQRSLLMGKIFEAEIDL